MRPFLFLEDGLYGNEVGVWVQGVIVGEGVISVAVGQRVIVGNGVCVAG
jgi:hypothetical protein